MSRYIDADNAIKDIRELAEKHHSNGEYQFANGVLKAITRIKSQPTADIAPVVCGEWVMKNDEQLGLQWFNCSICGRFEFNNSDFCPHCGADMRDIKQNVY